MSDNSSLDQIFLSIDKKLTLNLASSITDEEINEVYNYYLKEKIRFNKDQSQFIKPGRKSSKSSENVETLIQNIKDAKLDFS